MQVLKNLSKLLVVSALLGIVAPVVADVIKDDFLVNDDTAGRCPKWAPGVGMSSTGKFVVVWVDQRNGDNDIYCQRYGAAGNPEGENFRVNDDATAALQGSPWSPPSVTVSNTGGFTVVWHDPRWAPDWTLPSIFARRYDKEGNPVGGSFPIDDDVGGGEKPSVAGDGKGNFVVAWEKPDRETYPYARLFDSSGTPKTRSFRVSDTIEIFSFIRGPSVAMDSAGNFVVVWHYKNIIYARCFDFSGIPRGAEFRVSDDTTSRKDTPSAAMNKDGDLVVAWQDNRDRYFAIYAQKFDAQGRPVGTNFEVGDPGIPKRFPSVGMDGAGNFVVVWRDMRNGEANPEIYGQRFDKEANPLGPNFRMNDDTGENYQADPKVGVSDDGGFFAVWQDRREGWEDIYGQRYRPDGVPAGENIRVNDDEGTAHQSGHGAAMNDAGEFVLMWWDGRAPSGAYLQMYDSEGNPIGSNWFCEAIPGASSMAMDSVGNFIVVGEERWPGKFGFEIFGQRYDKDGLPIGPRFQVTNDTGSAQNMKPAIGMNRQGQFVVVWQRGYVGGRIFGRRYDRDGSPIGPEFQVSEDEIALAPRPPHVVVFEDGGFAVCYAEFYAFLYHARVRCYDREGRPFGPSIYVDEQANIDFPTIASDGIEKFVVVFTGAQWIGSDHRVCYQLFDLQGNPIGRNLEVPGSSMGPKESPVAVAMDTSGRFVIFWTDWSNPDGDPEVMAHRFNPDGTPLGGPVQINNPDLFPYNHQTTFAPGIALNNSQIIFCWHDDRRHKGCDIYAKLTDWELVGISEDVRGQMPDVSLFKLFPSPAKSALQIEFSLPKRGFTSLRLYDPAGRLVQTIVDKQLEKGLHTIKIDARDLPSGVYFLRLESGEKQQTEKLVLLK